MNDDKAMLLYHLVKSDEDWKTSADMIIGIINTAAEKFPAKPRILVLDIEGHRNGADGFDWDMMTLQRTVIMELLSPYLDEIQMPLVHCRVNPDRRRSDDDFPLKLETDDDEVQLLSSS